MRFPTIDRSVTVFGIELELIGCGYGHDDRGGYYGGGGYGHYFGKGGYHRYGACRDSFYGDGEYGDGDDMCNPPGDAEYDEREK